MPRHSSKYLGRYKGINKKTKANPKINYFNKFPDFKEANITIYNLAKEEYRSRQLK